VARLGLLPVSLGADSQPGAGDHVFGRIVLGRPLSRATMVFESIELEQLGVPRLPASSAAAATGLATAGQATRRVTAFPEPAA
jgi:hypothetical protein